LRRPVALGEALNYGWVSAKRAQQSPLIVDGCFQRINPPLLGRSISIKLLKVT
jgi:hypothetical protein